jgi:hypothetical protein
VAGCRRSPGNAHLSLFLGHRTVQLEPLHPPVPPPGGLPRHPPRRPRSRHSVVGVGDPGAAHETASRVPASAILSRRCRRRVCCASQLRLSTDEASACRSGSSGGAGRGTTAARRGASAPRDPSRRKDDAGESVLVDGNGPQPPLSQLGTAGSAQLLRDPSLARQLAAEVDQRDFVAIAEIRVHGYEYDTRIIESFLFSRR